MECILIRLFVPSAAPADTKLHLLQLAKTCYYLLQRAPGDFRCDGTGEELHIHSSPTTSQLYINLIDISVVRWVIDFVTTAKDEHDGSSHSSETGGISTKSDEMVRLGSLSDLRACLPFATLASRKKRYSGFHTEKIQPTAKAGGVINYCMRVVLPSDEKTDIQPWGWRRIWGGTRQILHTNGPIRKDTIHISSLKYQDLTLHRLQAFID